MIGRAILKYGRQSFDIVEVESCHTREQLDERERYWIAEFQSLNPNGYNIELGGSGSGKMSYETRRKIAAAHLGRKRGPRSEETKRKISESNKGKKISPEQIAQFKAWSAKHNYWRGREITPEHRANLSKAQKGHPGRPWTEEEKRHMSEVHKGARNHFFGKHHSEATKQKIRMNRKPPVPTDETRALMRDGANRRWEAYRLNKAAESKQKETT